MSDDEVETAIGATLVGNTAQLILRSDGTITVHEHVGQSWTECDDGITVLRLSDHASACRLRGREYDPAAMRAVDFDVEGWLWL